MQVPPRMRHRHLSALDRVLEVPVAAGRADMIPAIRLQFTDDVTRVFAHVQPRQDGDMATIGRQGRGAA